MTTHISHTTSDKQNEQHKKDEWKIGKDNISYQFIKGI